MITKKISFIAAGLLFLSTTVSLYSQKFIGTYINPARIYTFQEKEQAAQVKGGWGVPGLSWIGTATYIKKGTRWFVAQDFDIDATIAAQRDQRRKSPGFTIQKIDNTDPESDFIIFQLCLDKGFVLGGPQELGMKQEAWEEFIGPKHSKVEQKGNQWCYTLEYKILYTDEKTPATTLKK